MLIKNSKVLTISGKWLIPGESPIPPAPDPYNPLNLPPYTIRLKYIDGYTPKKPSTSAAKYWSSKQVSVSPNVWDISYTTSYWSLNGYPDYFGTKDNILEVLGANTTNVTDMSALFSKCHNLSSIALFDTSNVTTMFRLFEDCESLITVPLFNTSKVTSMQTMFQNCYNLKEIPLFDTHNVNNLSYFCYKCVSLTKVPLLNTYNLYQINHGFTGCYKVETGALALYQQMSTQATPPAAHGDCFYNCGRDTTTGAAELAQIPSGWK